MGYDVTNNSSILELGYAQPMEQTPLNTIVLPDELPSPPQLATESLFNGVVTSIPIPESLPLDPIVLVDPSSYVGGTPITIPEVVPPDGVILLESIPIPNFLTSTGDIIGITRLEDLTDVDISTRNDGDVLVYNSTTNTYEHRALTSGDLHYIHNQAIAAQVWNIIHNLGKRPAIHVEDMSGNEMIPQIIHIDNNTAQAVFGNATYSGTAYCN